MLHIWSIIKVKDTDEREDVKDTDESEDAKKTDESTKGKKRQDERGTNKLNKMRAPYSLQEDLCKVKCLIDDDIFCEGKVYLALRKRIMREETGKESVFEPGVDAFDENGKKWTVMFWSYSEERIKFVVVKDGEYTENQLAEYPKDFDVQDHIITRDEIPRMWIYQEEMDAFLDGKIDPLDRVGDELMIDGK